MMATTRFSGSTPEHFPSQEVHEALRISVAKLFAGENTEEDVCAALERLAEEARSGSVRVETMLIVFKEVWKSETNENAPRSSERNQLLSRLVSLCIDRYYQQR